MHGAQSRAGAGLTRGLQIADGLLGFGRQADSRPCTPSLWLRTLAFLTHAVGRMGGGKLRRQPFVLSLETADCSHQLARLQEALILVLRQVHPNRAAAPRTGAGERDAVRAVLSKLSARQLGLAVGAAHAGEGAGSSEVAHEVASPTNPVATVGLVLAMALQVFDQSGCQAVGDSRASLSRSTAARAEGPREHESIINTPATEDVSATPTRNNGSQPSVARCCAEVVWAWYMLLCGSRVSMHARMHAYPQSVLCGSWNTDKQMPHKRFGSTSSAGSQQAMSNGLADGTRLLPKLELLRPVQSRSGRCGRDSLIQRDRTDTEVVQSLRIGDWNLRNCRSHLPPSSQLQAREAIDEVLQYPDTGGCRTEVRELEFAPPQAAGHTPKFSVQNSSSCAVTPRVPVPVQLLY